jgi:hypothetical protein
MAVVKGRGVSRAGRHVRLPGASGSYVSAPDANHLDVTGDIDIRAEARLDWQSAATNGGVFVAKLPGTTNRAYMLRMSATGNHALQFIWSVDGTTATQVITISTAAVPFLNDQRGAVRVAMDVNNGSGQRVVRFYTASTINGPWTQLGADVVAAGTTSIAATNAQVEIGSSTGGTAGTFAGFIYAAEIRNGINGAVVANPRFNEQSAGVTAFQDSIENTWTVNGGAVIEVLNYLSASGVGRIRVRGQGTALLGFRAYGVVPPPVYGASHTSLGGLVTYAKGRRHRKRWEFIVGGDAEAAVVDILLNRTPELTPFSPTISTNLTGYVFGDRWVMVTQEGGFRVWPNIDRPRIDIQVFAERRSVARDIASLCLASIIRASGFYHGHGLTLTDAIVELGLTRVPDRRQEADRYIFALRLTTVPHKE